MNDRAVSETLSYIFVLSIVTIAISIAYLQANSIIDSTRTSVISLGAEESLRKVEYIIHSVAFGEAPSQLLELRIDGGSLRLIEDRPEFLIAIVNESLKNASAITCPEGAGRECINLSSGEHYSATTCLKRYDRAGCVYNTTTGTLRYIYSRLTVGAEGGGVFLLSEFSGRAEKVALNPDILIDTDVGGKRSVTASVPVVKGNLSFSGKGLVKFQIKEGKRRVFFTDVDWGKFDSIHVFVRNTDFAKAWCSGLSENLQREFSTEFSNSLYCNGANNCSCGDYAVHIVRKRSGDEVSLFIAFREAYIQGLMS